MSTKNLYCLIGPSGSGKTTLMNGLRKLGYTEAISHTTRKCRGEDDAGSYHFVDNSTFDEMVASGALVEHVTYAGNQYGISFQALNDNDFVILELQGVAAVKKLYTNRPVYVIGLVANPAVLAQRVYERDGNTDRLQHDEQAFREFEAIANCVIRTEFRSQTLSDVLLFMKACGEDIAEGGDAYV